jgi:hypothetical protein
MRRIILLSLLIFLFTAAWSQGRHSVKAIVLDSLSHEPVPLATVSVLNLKDSSLISYTITDKSGAFTLRNLRNEPSQLLISHVGYKGIHITIKFKNEETTDLGQILLSSKLLAEVTIKGERIPVTIKKDTIEFDAEAFKTRPNALVEDLLKKLPGIQVDRDGQITVNGKSISKIKVNGKTFFANDPTIATRSLEANMISKVQVYDDRDDDPDHLVPDYNVKKIINLKFKKSFSKGLLSTLSAGAGTQDRYIASGFAAKFQDDMQLSAAAGLNNLSNTGTFLGNYGGFNTFSFGNGGVSKTNNANIDLTKDISKKLKLHIEYRYNNLNNENSSLSRTLQQINDTIFNTQSKNISQRYNSEHTLHAETEWKPDSMTIIKYNPDIGYNYNYNQSLGNSTKSSTYFPLLNTIITGDNSDDNSFQYQHNMSYYRRLNKKGNSLTIGNSFNYHPEHSIDFSNNELLSYVALLPSDTLKRSSKNINQELSAGLNAAYHLILTKKLSADLAILGLYDQNKGDLVTYNEDLKTGLYDLFLPDQSSNLTRRLWGESFTPQLTYNFTDNISVKAGLIALSQQIGNHFNSYTNDLNQHFFYLFPSAELHLKALNLSYAETVQQPSINNLQPITIVYSPLYTFIGNPALKPTYYHNINFAYRKFEYQSGLTLNLNAHVVVERNTIVSEQTINSAGATVTTPINRNGRFTAYLNGNFNKQFKKRNKWRLGLRTDANLSAGHNFFIVNQENGYQNTQNIILHQYFTLDWNDLISIEPNYSVNYAVTQYQLVKNPNTSFTTQGAGLFVDISLPEKFRWKINYTHNYNPAVAPGFQRSTNLLNFSISERIQKNDRGEIGLTCYDLLNQDVSTFHNVSGNSINDSQTQVLKRYLLLTYTYHFKKFR